jgi:UDPglucose--hexose-1-phosphate uridylyltransferase
MSVHDITGVVEMWTRQFDELAAFDFVRYVQIFENRGGMMGASSPHPHCQIWATGSVPNEPSKEQRSLLEYQQRYRKCLLCEYVHYEQSNSERLIFRNESFVVVVPFWAVWPFETLIVPLRHVPDMRALTAEEQHLLAATLKQLTATYDRLFQTPFPYSMGFHQQPTDGELHSEWHLHAHFYPPLLRSAGIRKFMVGFEMLGTPQRDITPEAAAERLRKIWVDTGTWT